MLLLILLYIAPPLSVDNVMAVLKGLEGRWSRIGDVLFVPEAVLYQIQADSSSNHDRLKSVVRYWVLKDPLASWRRLIWRLDRYGGDLKKVAESIMNYAEKLTGQWIVK